MAFINRGEIPSVGNDNIRGGPSRYVIYGSWFHTYVPLDNTYVIMQMIVTFIILIAGLVTFFATYKSTIVDPIEGTKKIFINTYLIIIGVLLVLTLITNFLSKNEKSLITRLVVIAVISILVMFVFLGIKLNFDKTYIKDWFEQSFTSEDTSGESNGISKTKIDIGITGMSLKTEKEYYVDECLKLYNIFNVKTYATLGIHLLLNILLIYQILKISKIEKKKDKVDKDSVVLFDEEQNIKI